MCRATVSGEIFLIAIHSSEDRGQFTWPQLADTGCNLDHKFLCSDSEWFSDDEVARRRHDKVFDRNCCHAFATLQAHLKSTGEHTALGIADFNASPTRKRCVVNAAPTLQKCKAEARAYYVVSLKAGAESSMLVRPLAIKEYARLQGWDETSLTEWLGSGIKPLQWTDKLSLKFCSRHLSSHPDCQILLSCLAASGENAFM